MNKETKCSPCDLWDEFLNMGEKYQNNFTPQEFGFHLVKFVAKMFLDVAPSKEAAEKTLNDAVNLGFEWSREEEENN